jgi:hypothetical protein
MCTGPHDFNGKDLAGELDRTAPWVNDGAEGWRRELIVAVIAF